MSSAKWWTHVTRAVFVLSLMLYLCRYSGAQSYWNLVRQPSSMRSAIQTGVFQSFARPVITRIDPVSAALGVTISVFGSNLSPQGSLVKPRVVFETRPTLASQSALSVSGSELEAVVPLGSGTIGIHVETAGGNSNVVSFMYKVPVIKSISPPAGSKGQLVTVTGSSFGVRQQLDPSYIKFGSSLAQALQWNDDKIVVNAPTDFGTGTSTDILLGLMGCAAGSGLESEAAKLILDLSLPGCKDLFTKTVALYRLATTPGFLERRVQVLVHTSTGNSNQNTFTYRVQVQTKAGPGGVAPSLPLTSPTEPVASTPGNIPDAIKTLLAHTYPGWAPVHTSQENITICKQPNPAFQYWFVWGDFNGDGQRDYAAEITQGSTTYVVAFMANGNGFKPIVVDTFAGGDGAHGWSVLGVAGRGQNLPDLHEGVNGQLVARQRTLQVDALLGIGCETSAVAYIYSGSGFERIFISD